MNQSEPISSASEPKAAESKAKPSAEQLKQIFNADGSVLHCQENGIRTLVDADVAVWLKRLWLICFKDGLYAAYHRNRKVCYLHREIMECPENMVVDHANGDTFDNRRCNLRVCSTANNVRNRVVLNKNNTTGKRGVTYDARRDMWHAVIKHNRKSYYLGRFGRFEDAKAAREKAEVEFWGLFCGKV